MLALGAAAGGFAALYWTSPSNSVRWSFTQFHTSLVRGNRRTAEALVAPRVVLSGREMRADEFLAGYQAPRNPGPLEVAPCPSAPDHWTVAMSGQSYCFLLVGRAWKLHRIGPPPCGCR
jgi:hypothetical protein